MFFKKKYKSAFLTWDVDHNGTLEYNDIVLYMNKLIQYGLVY